MVDFQRSKVGKNIISFNIAIIGAGQMGSRHLQGLSTLDKEVKITLFDPDKKSLSFAKRRYESMQKNNQIISINYLQEFNKCDNYFDLVIIATNADIRKRVIEELLINARVSYLILEKVAFQSVKDFKKIIKLLDNNKIKSWVNCPHRTYPFFHQLKINSSKAELIKIIVEGSNWGLACNAIHFIDLLSFLSDRIEFRIVLENLYNEIYESKRKGFLEFGGKIIFKTDRGDSLELIDYQKKSMHSHIIIEFDDKIIKIDKHKQSVEEFSNISKKLIKKNSFIMPLQSEITGSQVSEILDTGNSQLTVLHDSFYHHKTMLNAFNKHLSRIKNKKIDLCQIT